MNRNRTTALLAAPVALALLLAGCAGGMPESMPGMDHGATASPNETAEADFNSADSMFVSMMIPHHEQAVEMSDMILAKEGVDQQVLDLAQQVKDAQQPEIDQMEGWLEDWGVAPAGLTGMSGMDHGDGMMSDSDMTALEEATGPEAARLWLEQMILHHEGAVAMAEVQLNEGKFPAALELAQAVVDTQTAEIQTMQELLSQL